MFSRDLGRAHGLVIKVEFVLAKHVFAKILRKIDSFLYQDRKINTLSNQVLRCVRQDLLWRIVPSVLVSRQDVNLQFANDTELLAANKRDRARIIDQVSKRLEPVVPLPDELWLRRIKEWIIFNSEFR